MFTECVIDWKKNLPAVVAHLTLKLKMYSYKLNMIFLGKGALEIRNPKIRNNLKKFESNIMNTSMISSRLNVHNIFHKIALRQGTLRDKVKPKKIMMMSLIKIVCIWFHQEFVHWVCYWLKKKFASCSSTSYTLTQNVFLQT